MTAVRQQITSQTAQTYDTLRVALRHRADLTESRQLSADFLKKTQARFNAGTAAKLDVVRAQVDLGQSDNALLGNARDIANARASLNRLLGGRSPRRSRPRTRWACRRRCPICISSRPVRSMTRPELCGLRAQQAGAAPRRCWPGNTGFPISIFGALKDSGAPNASSETAVASGSTGLTFPMPDLFLPAHCGRDRAGPAPRARADGVLSRSAGSGRPGRARRPTPPPRRHCSSCSTSVTRYSPRRAKRSASPRSATDSAGHRRSTCWTPARPWSPPRANTRTRWPRPMPRRPISSAPPRHRCPSSGPEIRMRK